VLFIKGQPDSRSSTRLPANIDSYFLNIANANRYQPANSMPFAKTINVDGNIIQNTLADISTVKQAWVTLCGHYSSPEATAFNTT
jgi:hypothetical protein